MTITTRRALATALLLSANLVGCVGADDGVGPIAAGEAEISADITADRTFYAETTYTLTNWVHVTNGVTLTIRPGTTIEGRTGSALFVLRGARIVADGRADAPIVFTSDQPQGQRKPGDWGGLILVGRGIINRTGTIELEGTGGSNPQNYAVNYDGGSQNNDDSGILRYVRVEFAGFGQAQNQELNSFTFAAVGSGTTVDHLEALAGFDDSFEWFGGAVDGKYLVSYEAGDDHFDAAEGYVGRNQYLIGFQSTFLAPRAGAGLEATDQQGFEIDNCGAASGSGCAAGYNSTPLTMPMFANFTLVGTGANQRLAGNNGGFGMVLRRGAGGYYVNGIIARWPKAAISMRDTETQTRATEGALVLRNIAIVETGTTGGTNAPIFETGTACPAANCRSSVDGAANSIVAEAGTVTAASLFQQFPAAGATPTSATLDWALVASAAPATGGTGAFTGALQTKAGSFVTGTAYRGAYGVDVGKWWTGWTSYAQN
ncbi:MAG TPA: hypothetical protein VNA89_04630 [Gemmatimonadaceae bacterium]|nr:hypothetical protein [Gemmatimonadaceae bacterium]